MPGLFAILAGLVMFAGAAQAADDIEWRYRAGNGTVSLTANPLSPAQRTAFYLARGFPASAIRPYAEACGFSFGMSNSGAGAVRTTLAEWRATGAEGRRASLRLPAAWEAEWARAGVPEPARIAFRWAQFQAENTFEAGDWIMGMATLDAPLPAGFRLVARYHDDKGTHEIVLDALSCARD